MAGTIAIPPGAFPATSPPQELVEVHVLRPPAREQGVDEHGRAPPVLLVRAPAAGRPASRPDRIRASSRRCNRAVGSRPARSRRDAGPAPPPNPDERLRRRRMKCRASGLPGLTTTNRSAAERSTAIGRRNKVAADGHHELTCPGLDTRGSCIRGQDLRHRATTRRAGHERV